jgi:hypothetical protein
LKVADRPKAGDGGHEIGAAKRPFALYDKLSSMYCVPFQRPPSRQFKRVFILFMASLASGMAGADPPVVTGYTSASNKSVEGIRNLLVLLVCPQLQSIVAESPPNGFDPRATPELPTTLVKRPVGPIRFEQWTVAGCGRTGQFLIQLWYDASGDEQYSASPPKGWLDTNADVLTIRISEDGICHVLDDSMPCDQLRPYLLTKHLAQNGHVHIAVDRTSKYELVAATLESLQGLGLKIGFVNNDASASQ